MREIAHLVLVLGMICGISAGSLESIRTVLSDRIELQNDLYIRGPALERLFKQPAKDILNNKLIVETETGSVTVFYTTDNTDLRELALEVSGKGGYGGDISILLGVDMTTRKLLGIEIIQHKETPGLGSRIEKPAFRKQWQNLPLHVPPRLKANGGTIDGITGATFSTNAILNGSQTALTFLEQYENQIKRTILDKSADLEPISLNI
ncbi:MAG: FMN-binding protein [Candidatus Marinimicrobia bacterium]|nr:FMN-binding protein [Candidatus Neomarinimicrobiota bacterium]